MENIVFLDNETLAPQVTLRRPAFDHAWTAYDSTAPDQVVPRCRDASIVVLNKVRLTAEAMEQLPALKLVAVAATGTDCVDKEAAKARGITVVNIRGYAVHTVPEHTFALILALQRAIVPYRAAVLDGAWQRSGQFCFFDAPIRDLGGKRLGIVGAGVLGSRVAAIGRAFDMVVRLYDPWAPASTPDLVSFEDLIGESDIITLHCPLTADTEGLIGMAAFRRMKRQPLIINTARGGIVVEDDLETALDEGLVSGAGIDVTMPEPPPADGPLMRMAARPNVIVTPHVAWASNEAQQALADQLIGNIEAYVAGTPRNVV
ncbi:D-2-hydroxyacid dehydrogenase [Mongoliimonas terrestris]|uniref:D-2-hydroxyacid dehydrogenase n=1 Tax=Mongoliimonas terrestris TaxID=1709001 RepID=UPI0009499939|nr:D-2-hydroxyacid dehydrogenase [Mongoliimonas terrestris]